MKYYEDLTIAARRRPRRWIWQRGFIGEVVFFPEAKAYGYTRNGALRASARKWDKLQREAKR